MDATGLDFTCGTCHKTSGHDVPGSRYTPVAVDKNGPIIRGKEADRNPTTCVACHGNTAHKEARLNQHARTLACQTCHVPKIARGGVATKMGWDWSTAGKLKDGKRQLITDNKGRVTYDSRKGDFAYGENIPPEYIWFNGKVDYTLLSDKIAKADAPVGINRLAGSPSDGKSMIWPVKIFRGKQAFDPVNNTLVKPHTAGEDHDAYWESYDWKRAIAAGMADAKAPFSGSTTSSRPRCRGRSPIWSRPRTRHSPASNVTCATMAASPPSPASTCPAAIAGRCSTRSWVPSPS